MTHVRGVDRKVAVATAAGNAFEACEAVGTLEHSGWCGAALQFLVADQWILGLAQG